MFVFKKILTPFLLPPGIFITLLMVSAGRLFLGRKWKTGLFNFGLALIMWALSISPVTNIMLRGLEYNFDLPRNPRGDVIILLGGGVYDRVPDLTGIGAPSGMMLARIVTAVRLQKRLKIPIVVSGGKVYEHKSAEAPIVKRFLVDLGVPAQRIILEEKSRDTLENAMYVREICVDFGYKTPILVTSAYHLKRALMSFNKVGMDVQPFPANFLSTRDAEYEWNDYLPGNSRKAFVAIHEYLGLVFYSYWGTK